MKRTHMRRMGILLLAAMLLAGCSSGESETDAGTIDSTAAESVT